MKRAMLLNSEISYAIAKMGHFDAITICDAGLPIPKKYSAYSASTLRYRKAFPPFSIRSTLSLPRWRFNL